MNKSLGITIFFIGIIMTSWSSSTLAADIEAGEQIFNANCAACHAGGKNAIIANKTLEQDVLEKYDMYDIDAITTQVTNGKGAMPAFGGRLEPEDIENVGNYVLSQAEKGW
uniref:Cytochrome c6 n=1 Tax=Dichotomaria marginata TaxID=268567 RepID=A0A1G4NSI0_9FLOR|nr:Cytochrome c553 [Dichotomaria marginata]SCW21469.1 Cytochrome c553 [Dichotomaria marginata]